jgi:hypothetical protein
LSSTTPVTPVHPFASRSLRGSHSSARSGSTPSRQSIVPPKSLSTFIPHIGGVALHRNAVTRWWNGGLLSVTTRGFKRPHWIRTRPQSKCWKNVASHSKVSFEVTEWCAMNRGTFGCTRSSASQEVETHDDLQMSGQPRARAPAVSRAPPIRWHQPGLFLEDRPGSTAVRSMRHLPGNFPAAGGARRIASRRTGRFRRGIR